MGRESMNRSIAAKQMMSKERQAMNLPASNGTECAVPIASDATQSIASAVNAICMGSNRLFDVVHLEMH